MTKVVKMVIGRPGRINDMLAAQPLFRELPAADINTLGASTELLHPLKGEFLFHRGDVARGFYIVVHGQIKLAMPASPDGEKVVDLLGPGKSFGAAIMFLEGRYPVSAEAVADSSVLLIPSRVLLAAIERTPMLARRMLAGLSMKLHGLIKDVEAYSVQSAMQRVLGFLSGLVLSADTNSLPLQVRLPASKRVIASRLNLTPETFSRLLHRLIEQGIIEVQGRVLIVPDPARLEAGE